MPLTSKIKHFQCKQQSIHFGFPVKTKDRWIRQLHYDQIPCFNNTSDKEHDIYRKYGKQALLTNVHLKCVVNNFHGKWIGASENILALCSPLPSHETAQKHNQQNELETAVNTNSANQMKFHFVLFSYQDIRSTMKGRQVRAIHTHREASAHMQRWTN